MQKDSDMNMKIAQIAEDILNGETIGRGEIEFLFSLGDENFDDLLYWANRIREKFFGKKNKEVINQNYFQLFIPQILRKKCENEMKKLVDELQDGKIKMKVITSADKTEVVQWTMNVLLNNQKMAAGIILSIKK